MRMVEKSLLLQMLDQSWKEHLLALDHLRQGIDLRAYAPARPLNEYKREAFELFEGMLVELREQVTSVLAHVELQASETSRRIGAAAAARAMLETREDPATSPLAADAAAAPRRLSPWANTPRNAPCPCGSGKKYKHCHGRL